MSGQHVQAPLGQFLTLAPATSDSYPTVKSQQTQEQNDAAPPAHRRTSSSSTTSSTSTRRFLKLNPVHLGEHLGEDQADWHEVAVE